MVMKRKSNTGTALRTQLGEPGEQARVVLRGHKPHLGSSFKCVLTGAREENEPPGGDRPGAVTAVPWKAARL